MNKKMFYARPGQLLYQHLVNVSKMAAEYAKSFGCEDVAAFCGLIHDFGKYSESFQKVLNNEMHGVDHASAGALLSRVCYGRTNQIGRVIWAHHASLEHFIDGYLRESISNAEAIPPHKGKTTYAINSEEKFKAALAVWKREVGIDNIAALKTNLPSFKDRRNPALSEMLFNRFLLSCLVDADYSDAAKVDNPDYKEQYESVQLSPETLLNRLLIYVSEIKKKSTDSHDINQLRDMVFSNCMEAASLKPGLYTLTAPTGLGKTLAMLAFALKHAKEHKKRRIIFVLPYLSIIEQNADIYRLICPELLEDHSQCDLNDNEREYTERYDAPIIVTTSVKFFESFFKSKAPDCRKLHNITNSIIMFDEAQSLPSGLISTTLQTIEELCEYYKCTVVFSTATQPAFEFRENVSWKPVEIIKNPSYLYERTKRCAYGWRINRPTSLNQIALEMSEENNCCAIVNTKKQASELYDSLIQICDPLDCFYITTDLCPDHRRNVLKEIKTRQSVGRKCLVVSTQCIEAGVDISFDCMYRALSPLSSIIQSAGRVNRGGIKHKGKFIVFLPDTKRLYPDPSYENASVAVLTLLSRYGEHIDLNDLDVVCEYYEILFRDGRHNHDNPNLTKAIAEFDYAAVEKAYRLIENNGVNVIVPYKSRLDLFYEIREEGLERGITNALMKKAAPIVVNTYDEDRVKDLCIRLYYPVNKRRHVPEKSNWYITDEVVGLYEDVKGLNLSNSKDIPSIF